MKSSKKPADRDRDRDRALIMSTRIVMMAEDALKDLNQSIDNWPNYARAIVWDAVAELAKLRADKARKPYEID